MAASRKHDIKASTLARLVAQVTALQQATQASTAAVAAMVPAPVDELAALRRENAALKQQLELVAPAGSAGDLATALQSSLDQIQASCAKMDNPVSTFAVKEFSLQANVVVQLDPLGQARYRFLRAGESVDERVVSRLTIALVPLPKETPQGEILAKTANVPVLSLHGLGPDRQKKLNEQAIYSVADLVRVGTRLRGEAQLCAMLGVEREQVAAWLDEAALMSIADVGEAGAALLWRAGVRTAEDLGCRNAAALMPLLEKRLSKPLAKKLGPVDVQRISTWIAAAKPPSAATATPSK